MYRFLIPAAAVFVVAGALAITAPSTWPLLVVRVVLIAVGIALVVVALKRRRMTA